MGKKNYCFKHDKILSSSSKSCKNFRLKIDEEMKKKWGVGEAPGEENGEIRGVEMKVDFGYDKNLFLAVFGVGFVVILLVLWAAGIF
jgi:hypothetical protein